MEKILKQNFIIQMLLIAVGYRVNSKQATKFIIWATNILKEYIIKGFKIDKERIKIVLSLLKTIMMNHQKP